LALGILCGGRQTPGHEWNTSKRNTKTNINKNVQQIAAACFSEVARFQNIAHSKNSKLFGGRRREWAENTFETRAAITNNRSQAW
jgi:hypothetical protein